MESSERNRNSYGSTRLRLSLYAIIFALILVAPIVEMKTGIPLGRDRSTARFHDALSWDEVWAQLPGTLLLYLVIAAPIFALIEWSIRRKMKGYSSVLDSESERDDSPAKPFTGLWRIATIAYFGVAVIALYVYWRGGWDWGPLPLAAFAPIPISLGLLAIYAGEFQMRGGAFYRSKNPIGYWACVATILSIGIALFLAGIGVIGT
jgi:hypothetical protein